METHRLCQVLPCCWRAQHNIAGLLASLFCCLSFGKAIGRYMADHLFDSRKNRPRSILGCFFSLSVFFFCNCTFSLFTVILDFYLITGDWFLSWCVHGYRSWSEGLPESCWTDDLCRLYQIFSCASCDPARKRTTGFFLSGFLRLGRGVVWASVVRSVDKTLSDIYQAWLLWLRVALCPGNLTWIQNWKWWGTNPEHAPLMSLVIWWSVVLKKQSNDLEWAWPAWFKTFRGILIWILKWFLEINGYF